MWVSMKPEYKNEQFIKNSATRANNIMKGEELRLDKLEIFNKLMKIICYLNMILQ